MKQKKAMPAFTIVFVSLFVLGMAANSWLFFLAEKNTNIRAESNDDALLIRRAALEREYPQFSDFENQESFAGKAVKYAVVDGDYYFAYMILGSGLPIAKATCFRVDRMGRVYVTGEFPDMLDSYAGYPDINPVNCKGIKIRLEEENGRI